MCVRKPDTWGHIVGMFNKRRQNMTRQELMDAISPASRRIVGFIMTFAGSQGSYGRLLQALLDSDPDDAEEWLSRYHHCNDYLDFVMECEGG